MTLQTLSITFISMGVGACMAAAQDRGLCPHVLARLVPQRVLTLQDERLARVEVRDCPAWGQPIQLSGWERDAGAPTLIVDTTDNVIGQLVMTGDVFVIVTEGGTRSWVYVITFSKGKPKLALTQVTKGIVRIVSDYWHVELGMEGLNGKAQSYRFSTGN